MLVAPEPPLTPFLAVATEVKLRAAASQAAATTDSQTLCPGGVESLSPPQPWRLGGAAYIFSKLSEKKKPETGVGEQAK